MAHILIIEDYRDTREVTEYILREAGHEVTSVTNGLLGVTMAQRHQPDLILMDLALPYLDGWAATERLSTSQETQHIPVIAFTAHLNEEDLKRALEVGCIAVVAKPFDIDILLSTIHAVLATSSKAREAGG
jgi:two-component system, cell cycle response regulator DivK